MSAFKDYPFQSHHCHPASDSMQAEAWNELLTGGKAQVCAGAQEGSWGKGEKRRKKDVREYWGLTDRRGMLIDASPQLCLSRKEAL